MTQTLPSPRFDFAPQTGAFTWQFLNGISISEAHLAAEYQVGNQRSRRILNRWRPLPAGRPFGFEIAPDTDGISFSLYFEQRVDGLFAWKLAVYNQGRKPAVIHRLDMLRQADNRQVEFTANRAANPAFFENGWQSWSYSAAYSARQKAPRTIMGGLFPGMWTADGTPTPRRRGYFGSDFFGVLADRTGQSGCVVGFLSQRQMFGTITAQLAGATRLAMWANGSGVVLPPGAGLETDSAVMGMLDLDQPDPLGVYLEAVAHENHARVPNSVPVGWCSWYHFYQQVGAKDIETNLRSAVSGRGEWPLDLIQIDVGFETLVGEWDRFNKRFPQGVAGLAEEIHQAGMIPGIWLAPFLLQPKAENARLHPEWMIKDRNGKPRSAGFHWNSRTVALDLTHPEACAWVETTIRRAVEEWGFPYLKLDFLYAGGLTGGRLDPTKTNAQVLHNGLELIRRAAGEETFLLGCGCPVGSGVGIFDAMRISADTAPAWGTYFYGKQVAFLREPHGPAAENALQNILTRANLHRRWWWNDPDCLLMRPESQLTLPEIQTIASAISLTGGMLLVSDDLPRLPAERVEILSQLIPVISHRGEVLDWLDREQPTRIRLKLNGPVGEWVLLAWINRNKQSSSWRFDPTEWGLERAIYWLRSFWDGQINRVSPGEAIELAAIPPHGTALLAVRRETDAPLQFIGGTLHISQGMEVNDWQMRQREAEFEVNLPRSWQGEIFLRSVSQPSTVSADEARVNKWNWEGQILRVQISGSQTARIKVMW